MGKSRVLTHVCVSGLVTDSALGPQPELFHRLSYVGVDGTVVPYQITSHRISLRWQSAGVADIFCLNGNFVGSNCHKERFQHIKARRPVLAILGFVSSHRYHMLTKLAIVATLAVSISARPTDADANIGACPVFCVRQSNCKHCPDKNCIIYICF
ncbi:hypothetical protein BDR06DRAFT_957120 [Suillus hirtellus]|nr:hypothetical protein BDR06DRAFT_957120 [Suillus hirtellus]